MKRTAIMLVAGDPSGDANAAALVRELAVAIPVAQFQITDDTQPLTAPLAPCFFGAGGPKMAAAGVELTGDLTAQSVIGLGGLIKKLPMFRRLLRELTALAVERQPEIIILVDYGGFNLRLARAIKDYVRARTGPFFNWRPKIVQFISPQVWATRPGRANSMARNYDLVLSLFPFEQKWFAANAPGLPVEFVGHPIFDTYPGRRLDGRAALPRRPELGRSGSFALPNYEISGIGEIPEGRDSRQPVILLLPGSRRAELRRHVPVMREAAALIAARQSARFKMIVPDETMAQIARSFLPAGQPAIDLQTGGLAGALSTATLAITKSGTITLECAYFGVPAVTLYKTDPITYQFARHLANVKYLSMPNLLADEPICPELIQGRATPGNIAAAALELLADPARRAAVRSKLDLIIQSLGGPGATRRAAAAILKVMRQ